MAKCLICAVTYIYPGGGLLITSQGLSKNTGRKGCYVVTMNQVLNGILTNHGLKVIESSIEERKVLGTKEGNKIYVGYVLEDDDPLDTISNHKIRSDMDDIIKTIIVCLAPVTTSIKRVCEEYGFELWDGDRFINEIGRAIYQAIDFSGKDSGTPELLTDDQGPEIKESEASLSLFQDLVQEHMGQESGPEALRVVKPKFGLEHVKGLIKDSMGMYECQLQLVPMYIYHYECTVVSEDGGESMPVSGEVWVNAVTGLSFEGKREAEIVNYLDWEYSVIEPKIDPREGAERAREAAAKANTKVAERIEESETSTIIERVSYRPKEDSISVNYRGMIYQPLWGIAGKDGIMLINATNGEVIKEESFYRPE